MARAFANLEGLMRLSQREGVDIRPSLLRVLTDLYVQNESHTREEEQQYVELALRLLPSVDAATRSAVAMKLVTYPRAPGVLLAQLAGEIASAKQDAPQDALTLRPRISDRLPAATPSIQEQSLPAAPLRPLRPDASVSIGERFLRGTAQERREQLRSLAAEAPVQAAEAASEECLVMLERAALELRPRDFAAELQRALGLSQRTAVQIVQDDEGEPVLVVARALGMHVDRLLRVLLFLNPSVGQSVDRVFSLYRLYEEISAGAAQAIVASWREGSGRTGAHQPVHAPDSERRDSTLLQGIRRGADSGANVAAGPNAETGKRQATT